MAGTSLSQDFDGMEISAPPGLPPSSRPPSSHTFGLTELALREMVESEALKHFDLVQATADTDSVSRNALVSIPADWASLAAILKKLAYDPDTANHWEMLGLGPLCGPEPTELVIADRSRVAKLLCSLGEAASWSSEDKDKAQTAIVKFSRAALHCEESLPEILRTRRQMLPDKLPRWKELGNDAFEAIRSTPGSGSCTFITQWSQVLDPLGAHETTVAQQRAMADKFEKGDIKVLETLKGREVVAWSPFGPWGTQSPPFHLSEGDKCQLADDHHTHLSIPLLPRSKLG
jgi:hypothetical protein